MKKECSIIIDTREQEFGVIVANKLTSTFHRSNVEIHELDVGDYQIELRDIQFTIERKSASDFAASLKDGRLERQALKMASYQNPILLIHGDIFKASLWKNTNLKIPNSISRLLSSLTIKRMPGGEKLQIIQVPFDSQVAVIVDYIARKIENDEILLTKKLKAKSISKSKIKKFDASRHGLILQDIFARIDRMPYNVAEMLVKKCDGNFEIFMGWTEQDIKDLKIRGLGTTLIKRLYDQFHEVDYRPTKLKKPKIKKVK